jgi:hypothetical protein
MAAIGLPWGLGWLGTSETLLALDGSDLYAGGEFNAAGGVANTNYIAKWDGSNWSALGAGLNVSVRMASLTAVTYMLGVSSLAARGGGNANDIAKWDGSSWSALGTWVGGTTFITSPLTAPTYMLRVRLLE